MTTIFDDSLSVDDASYSCSSMCTFSDSSNEGCRPCAFPLPTARRVDEPNRRKNLSPTDGEILQARDLESLTVDERNRAYEDVHGVSSSDFAVPDIDVLQQCLDAMDEKLRNTRVKKPYDLAMFLFPRYAKSAKLRLTFLIAVDFDAQQAARRLMLFFSVKLKLFGPEMLGREIMMKDLTPECQATVRSGCCQFFPLSVRDRSGRTVYAQFAHLLGQSSNEDIVKAFFYTSMAAVREMSPADQHRGTVAILHSVGTLEASSSFWDLIVKGVEAAKSLPLKATACHVCYDSLSLQPAASLIQVSVSKFARVRIRSFYGSFLESMYYLNSFGIDGLRVFGFHDDWSVDVDKLGSFVETRVEFENNYKQLPMEVPTQIDVLLGRGKSYQAHAGNIAFLKIVERYNVKYMSADKPTKRQIVEQIRRTIENNGGRFLRLTSDALDWEPLSTAEACRKIRNAFRSK